MVSEKRKDPEIGPSLPIHFFKNWELNKRRTLPGHASCWKVMSGRHGTWEQEQFSSMSKYTLLFILFSRCTRTKTRQILIFKVPDMRNVTSSENMTWLFIRNVAFFTGLYTTKSSKLKTRLSINFGNPPLLRLVS
jgi:hypothetical protein